jgi:hypothetical protein
MKVVQSRIVTGNTCLTGAVAIISLTVWNKLALTVIGRSCVQRLAGSASEIIIINRTIRDKS